MKSISQWPALAGRGEDRNFFVRHVEVQIDARPQPASTKIAELPSSDAEGWRAQLRGGGDERNLFDVPGDGWAQWAAENVVQG